MDHDKEQTFGYTEIRIKGLLNQKATATNTNMFPMVQVVKEVRLIDVVCGWLAPGCKDATADLVFHPSPASHALVSWIPPCPFSYSSA